MDAEEGRRAFPTDTTLGAGASSPLGTIDCGACWPPVSALPVAVTASASIVADAVAPLPTVAGPAAAAAPPAGWSAGAGRVTTLKFEPIRPSSWPRAPLDVPKCFSRNERGTCSFKSSAPRVVQRCTKSRLSRIGLNQAACRAKPAPEVEI